MGEVRKMKDRFNRFAVRFLTALLVGLLALLLHDWARNPALGIVMPKNGCAWELGKLAYWPMLATVALTGRLTGGVKKTFSSAAMWLFLTPLALFLAEWAVMALDAGRGLRVALWVALAAAGTALWDNEKKGELWPVLAIALGVLYVVFTFRPPLWGPFLDPLDAAAMAAIPY